MLLPKNMLQTLPLEFKQVQASNTSKNLLSESCLEWLYIHCINQKTLRKNRQ